MLNEMLKWDYYEMNEMLKWDYYEMQCELYIYIFKLILVLFLQVVNFQNITKSLFTFLNTKIVNSIFTYTIIIIIIM